MHGLLQKPARTTFEILQELVPVDLSEDATYLVFLGGLNENHDMDSGRYRRFRVSGSSWPQKRPVPAPQMSGSGPIKSLLSSQSAMATLEALAREPAKPLEYQALSEFRPKFEPKVAAPMRDSVFNGNLPL